MPEWGTAVPFSSLIEFTLVSLLFDFILKKRRDIKVNQGGRTQVMFCQFQQLHEMEKQTVNAINNYLMIYHFVLGFI